MRQTGSRGNGESASGNLAKSRPTGNGVFHGVKGLRIKDWVKIAPAPGEGAIAYLSHDALLIPTAGVVDNLNRPPSGAGRVALPAEREEHRAGRAAEPPPRNGPPQ